MNERANSKTTKIVYHKGASVVHLTFGYDDAYSAAVDADAILEAMNKRGSLTIYFGEKVSETDLIGSKS